MSPGEAWDARIRIHRPDPAAADRLAAALAPELSREVPRTRVRLARPAPGVLELTVQARDTGALRAGLNTLLGWVALTERIEAGLRV